MEKNEKPLNEHIEEIKRRMKYRINETPRYTPLSEDEFDDLPVEIYATQDGQPVPNPRGTDAYLEEQGNEDEIPAPEGPKEPVAEPSNARAPQVDDIPEPEGEMPPMPPEEGDEMPPEGGEEVDVDITATEEVPEESPQAELNDIQNEIIRHNLEATKDINTKMEELDSLMSRLDKQFSNLNAKVKEVEEPTNAEKLMNKKEISFPYYYNLNDFWKGNWFEEKRNQMNEKGITQLPDGTFIADFDDLPTHNSMDIEDSFTKIV